MLSIWRGLVWTVGALSVAVLLRGAFDLSLVPAVQGALDAYDAALASALTLLEPFVALLLPPLKSMLGTGTSLFPHWMHVFLVAFLHMLPRVDATFGVGGAATAVLWGGQAILALAVALVSAAYVGAAPFVAPATEEGLFVGLFIASAFLINAFSNDRDSGRPADDTAEQTAAVDPWPMRYRLARGFAVAFFLAMICAIAIGLMMGWLDRESGERAFTWFIVANAVVLVIFLVARLIYSSFAAPRHEGIFLSNGLLSGIALMAMFLAVLVIADVLSPRIIDSTTAYGILVIGLVVLLLYAAARSAISRLVGRDDDTYAPRAVPALGMFLVIGATIVLAGYGATLTGA